MRWKLRRKRPTTSARFRLRESLERASRPGTRSFAELIGALEAAARAEGAGTALELLTERPAVVLRLDSYLRQEHWTGHDHPPVAEAEPVTLALLGSHPDGRVREAAVRQVLAQPLPGLMPFLVLRTGDWVPQVRDRARAGLALLLHDRPSCVTPQTVRTALLAAGRRRGSFALAQVRAALAADELGEGAERLLARHHHPEVRRFALEAVGHRLRTRDLLRLVELDHDRDLRARAAEAVAREAVWTEQHEILHRLAQSPYGEVRAAALTGLMRAGLPLQGAEHLDDPSPLVRALAREAVRRTGGDARAHYRAAVASGSPPPAAVDGLAEIGGPADAAALTALLGHPAPQVRARAVRALRLLGSVPVAELVPLLRDGSTAVVREAAAALLPSAGTLPEGLLGELFADPGRPDVRLAAYGMLRRRAPATALRAALEAAGDDHPRLAHRGRADALTLARRVAPEPWRTGGTPPPEVAPGDLAGLLVLLERSPGALPGDVLGRLRARLAGAASGD
ncbi:HEAT repeat domain-containing protein [Kitasatospora sp. NPDC057015]|uniref:HEAT repeat domain-containing protein n=1 Tax=Kitasatospora sp. NPDC057015 TaxID=3346001 RepID=UPI003635763B